MAPQERGARLPPNAPVQRKTRSAFRCTDC